ncbi:metallophosphoesterase [Diaphorobacter aerolatus]|uniref:Metallophosphoesterase n=1 Tax=Diaphorobacter aerolatus TaxID=1288495 RepID=A0A7H0GG06_9BURK|nr:metallophosphoesterase [Diaphorobacter aerolatus]QNP47222.1 metallophosphoesterase [Diaphorobacter aerolatus]
MRLQLLSDLHLETHPRFEPTPATGANALVLAGDIGSYQQGSRIAGEYFGLERFSPLPQFAHWPVPVIFVPGNHEYDNLDFDETHARLRATCDALGLIWLERETLVLDGVRFIGTTLWSDFDALAEDDAKVHPARYLQKREKAFRAANFYLRKTGGTRNAEPFLAEQMREQSLVCQEWLEHALRTPHADGPTAVITHFAPSLRSADPRYGLVPGTAGFCNALDHLLPYADLWMHGHLHAPSDYAVTAAREDGQTRTCRVVANPLGYAVKGEQETFRPDFCVEI